jgi:hypothetical protein
MSYLPQRFAHAHGSGIAAVELAQPAMVHLQGHLAQYQVAVANPHQLSF